MSRDSEGELVEASEGANPLWFLIGVQCHPERTETTPPEFERLFIAFVTAAGRRSKAR
jgi:gamma-glutamyl-gamma-aminobutyrate hydrolase PuuD